MLIDQLKQNIRLLEHLAIFDGLEKDIPGVTGTPEHLSFSGRMQKVQNELKHCCGVLHPGLYGTLLHRHCTQQYVGFGLVAPFHLQLKSFLLSTAAHVEQCRCNKPGAFHIVTPPWPCFPACYSAQEPARW